MYKNKELYQDLPIHNPCNPGTPNAQLDQLTKAVTILMDTHSKANTANDKAEAKHKTPA